MALPDLKDLQKLIALCKKTGVKTVKVDGLELTLSDDALEAAKAKKKKPEQDFSQTETESIPDFSSLTPEQQLLWSVQNLPPMTDGSDA